MDAAPQTYRPPEIPAFEGLFPNQFATLNELRRQVAAGATDITIWGISGSGKSNLTDRLKEVRGIYVMPEYSHSDDKISFNGVVIRSKTGLPCWSGNTAPLGHMYHAGFASAEDLVLAAASARWGQSKVALRNEEQGRDIAEQLVECGLGSTTLFLDLKKLPLRCDLVDELCKFTAKSCSAAENHDFAETFAAVANCHGSNRTFAISLYKALTTYLPERAFNVFAPKVPSDEDCFAVEQLVIGTYPIESASNATVEFYRKLDQFFPRPIEEPSFLIRSARPITAVEERQILEPLSAVLNYFDCDAYGLGERHGRFFVEGDAPRKTGLYRFVGEDRRVDNNYIYVREADLQPLIIDSKPSRALMSWLYIRDGRCVPKNTLIFGGGDHDLHRGHVCLSLAIELALQKANVPYDVVRGDRRNHAAIFHYQNGSFSPAK